MELHQYANSFVKSTWSSFQFNFALRLNRSCRIQNYCCSEDNHCHSKLQPNLDISFSILRLNPVETVSLRKTVETVSVSTAIKQDNNCLVYKTLVRRKSRKNISNPVEKLPSCISHQMSHSRQFSLLFQT